jgi:hypothetical protein
MNREIHRDAIHVVHIPPVKWHQRAKWKLLQSYISWNGSVVVPDGFITDGASIPWFLRWRFSPTGKYFGAAIVHDYILVTTSDWKRANVEFEHEMKALNVSKFDKTVMVSTVKVWAWFTSAILRRGPKEIK